MNSIYTLISKAIILMRCKARREIKWMKRVYERQRETTKPKTHRFSIRVMPSNSTQRWEKNTKTITLNAFPFELNWNIKNGSNFMCALNVMQLKRSLSLSLCSECVEWMNARQSIRKTFACLPFTLSLSIFAFSRFSVFFHHFSALFNRSALHFAKIEHFFFLYR